MVRREEKSFLAFYRSRLWVLASSIVFFSCCSVLSASSAFACPDIDGLVDTNCDGKLILFFYGDSITYGLRDFSSGITGKPLGFPGRMQATYFPSSIVRNAGNPGETSWTGVTRSAALLQGVTDIDYFFLLEGVNDYYDSRRSSLTTKNNLLSIFRNGRNTGGLVLMANLLDIRRSYQKPWVLSVNGMIDPLRQVNYFNLGTSIIGYDGLHPNSAGYQVMATRLATVLKTFSESHRPVDSDRDGLYDFEEARLGTNAFQTDSDGDGIPDGTEVWGYRSNPRSLDSDGDGLSDNFEVFVLHSDPASALPGAPTITDFVITPP